MTFNQLLTIALLAALPVVTGCGTSCESICEDSHHCPGEKQVDCAHACDEAENVSDDSKCSDRYDDLKSCLGDMDDICSSKDTSCDAQVNAYAGCVLPYCMNANHTAQCLAAQDAFRTL
jgi:hypothetical protein